MHKPLWLTPLAVAAIVALAAVACSSDDSSGLATLADVTTTVPDAVLTAAADDDVLTAAADDGAAAAVVATETTGTAPAVGEPGAAPAADADGDTPAEDDLSDEEVLLAFAACMRDNGVEFPDPIVEADGTVTFGLRPGAGGGQNAGDLQAIGRDPDLPAARDACSPLIEGRALGPGGRNSDEVQIEIADRLLEFAQCMRDNGVDVGDPDPNAFGPGSGGGRPFGDLDFGDADVSAAFEACSDQLPFGGQGRQGSRP